MNTFSGLLRRLLRVRERARSLPIGRLERSRYAEDAFACDCPSFGCVRLSTTSPELNPYRYLRGYHLFGDDREVSQPGGSE